MISDLAFAKFPNNTKIHFLLYLQINLIVSSMNSFQIDKCEDGDFGLTVKAQFNKKMF